MFPLPVALVGVDESTAPHVRRELLNQPAELDAEFPDARSLVQQARGHKKETHLVIAQVSEEEDLGDLRRLSATFPGWPVLALVGGKQAAGLYLKANRCGACQVVPLPLEPRDFADALRCIGLLFGYASRASTVVAVTGATGGCGATSLAINLAAEAAFCHELHSILVELTQQMGMVATYLDLEPRVTLPDLIRDAERLDAFLIQQSLTRVADNFDLLPGPQGLTSPRPVTAEEIFTVVDHMRRLAALTVLDVPGNYGDLQFEILTRADQVVLVGEQTIPSVRALKLMADSLRPQRSEGSLRVVINRYDPDLTGFTASDLMRLLRIHDVFTVMADAAAFKASSNQGRLLRLVAPRSPVLGDVDRLLADLLGLEAAPVVETSTKSGLFARLVDAFRR